LQPTNPNTLPSTETPAPQTDFRAPLRWLGALFLLVLLALLLAYISDAYQSFDGWVSFTAALLLGSGILALGWLIVRAEHPPRWLAALALGAALVRLAAGMIWFTTLPVLGHGTLEERTGYVMADARERDIAAWKLAQSDRPLLTAFRADHKADQYGGLLLLSAGLYRVLDGDIHQPLLIVVITAAFSALAVLFTWAFARRAWDDGVAGVAAWILALFPEAVLLGSSQMREGFAITLTMAAFYGLLRYAQEHARAGLALMLAAILLCLPFSPLLAGLLVIGLGILAFTLRRSFISTPDSHHRRLWLILIGVSVLVIAGLWITLRQLAPEGISNPLALMRWWVRESAEWQAHLSKQASGWMQRSFRLTPEWLHMPLLVAYGTLQPFLPAALIASSQSPIWTAIAIWRALGWTLILPLLIYAPLRALSGDGGNRLARALSLAAWLVILVAAFRGGGDLWDNPRYRAAFAGLYAALAAWVLVEQCRRPDPWMRRALVGVLLIIAWFLPWYLYRYLGLAWPVTDLFKTIGLGFASAILYAIWDWAR